MAGLDVSSLKPVGAQQQEAAAPAGKLDVSKLRPAYTPAPAEPVTEPQTSLAEDVGFAASRVGTAIPHLAEFALDVPQHLGAAAQFGVSGEMTGMSADRPDTAQNFDAFASSKLGKPDFKAFPARGYDPAKLSELYKEFLDQAPNVELKKRLTQGRLPEAYKAPLIGTDIFGGQLGAAAEGIKDLTGGAIDINKAFPEAKNKKQQVIEGVTEGIVTGGTSIPRSIARAALPQVFKKVGRVEADALRREVLTDMLTGGAGGYTGTLAAQNAPEGWELPASLAGGMAGGLGAVGTGKLAGATADKVGNYLRPAITTKGNIERMTGEALRNAATDPNRATDAMAAATAPEGVEYTTGQASQDIGLLSLEQSLARGKDQKFREAMVQRAREQNMALANAVRGIEQGASPSAMTSFFHDRMGQLNERLDQLDANARKLAEQEAAGLETPDAGDVGGNIQDALAAEMDRVKQEVAALDKAVDPTGTMRLPTGRLRTSAADIYADMSPEERLSITPEEKALLDVINGYGDTIPYQRFRDLRTQLNEDMRNARSAGKGRAYGRMSQLRGALEADISDAISGRFAREANAANEFVARARDWYERGAEAPARTGAAASPVGAAPGSASAVPPRAGEPGAAGREPGAVAGDSGLSSDEQAARAVEGRLKQSSAFQTAMNPLMRQAEALGDLGEGDAFPAPLRGEFEIEPSRGNRIQPIRDQAVANRVQADAEALSDFAQRHATTSEGGGFLPVPLSVLRHMLSVARSDDNVLRAIVSALPADVMNLFARKKIAPETALRNEAMLRNLLSVDRDPSVSLGVGPTASIGRLVGVVADMAAKASDRALRGRRDLMGRAGELPATVRAGEGDRAHTGNVSKSEDVARGPMRLAQSEAPAETKPAFYSAALKSVEDSKTNRASPQQWAATIKNTPGVKQEELDWLGLNSWLAQQKGAVTKEQVADYIRANQIEVEEVDLAGELAEPRDIESEIYIPSRWEEDTVDEYWVDDLTEEYKGDARQEMIDEGDDPEDIPESEVEHRARQRALQSAYDGLGSHAVVHLDHGDEQVTYDLYADSDGYVEIRTADGEDVLSGPRMSERDMKRAIARHFQEHYPEPDNITGDGPTQYGEYTLPGGKDYHELLLKLPERKRADDTAPSDAVGQKYDAEWKRLVEDWKSKVDHEQSFNRMPVGERFNSQEYIDARDAAREAEEAMDALHAKMVEETRATAAPWRQGENFAAPHYDDQRQNILAHVRFKDRTSVDGKRTLFLEEVQSDWHQQGRDKGYQGQQRNVEGWTAKEGDGDPASGPIWEVRDANGRWVMGIPRATAPTQEQAIRRAADSGRGERPEVPDAPFKTTWPELALKRMIRWAADNGYDQIAWTPGSVQNKRYNLSKQVNSVGWDRAGEVIKRSAPTAEKFISIEPSRGPMLTLAVDADGKVVKSSTGMDAEGKHLTEVLGKDLAQQIMADADGEITKAGLAEIGGSGMREFYDRVLVSLGNKLGKKFGTQVGKTKVLLGRSYAGVPDVAQEAPALPITDAMRAGAQQGFPLFQKASDVNTSPTEAQKEAGNYKKGHVRVGGLDISIENPAGSKRTGKDASGKPWSVDLKDHYGYVKGSVGKDKDHVDVFVSRDARSDLGKDSPVFVVNQINPKTGRFDEWKVMLGYPDVATARAAYLRNYAPGWRGLGTIAETNLGDFRTLIGRGFGKSPLKGAKGNARPQSASPLSRVVEYDGSGAKPEQSGVPQLRWQGHQLVGRNDELQRLPVGDRGNRGSAEPSASVGSGGQRRELLSRESALGDQARAGAQYAEEPSADGRRGNAAVGRMGGARELGAINDSLSSRAGDVGRASRVSASAVQRTGGVNAQGNVGAGGVRGVSGEAAPAAGNAGREADGSLRGLPRKIGSLTASAYPDAQRVAAAYMNSAGLEYRPPNTYAKVDPERATRIAAAYDEMEHAPSDPAVQRAYKAMADETLAQYQAMLDDGMKIEFIAPGQPDPYAGNPRNMTEDVRNNRHMWVFATRDGFGSDATFDASDNPLLAESGYEISGQPAVINDIFRAVHDYFGHVKEGVGFRADGEENAWRAHSAMYSPEARRAMTSETRGQNSWVNYGPFGESNRTARSEDTHYADQKIGLLPEWVVQEGAGDDTIGTTMAQRFARAGRPENEAQAAGQIVEAFYATLANRLGVETDAVQKQFPLPRVEGKGTGPLRQGERGSILLGRDGAPALISLFETADATTALHESAHQFLDMFSRVAGGKGAPEGLLRDWNATKAWWQKNAKQLAEDAGEGVTVADVRKSLAGESLGAKKDAAVARGMHEQWARAFEVYLRDGKAPNAAMKGLFDQFKDWLTQVYKSITGMGVDLSPDIRGVFDRMLGAEGGDLIDRPAAKRLSDVTQRWKDYYGTYTDKSSGPVPAIVRKSKGESYPFDMPPEAVTKATWKPGPDGATAIRNILKGAGQNRAAAMKGIEQSAMLSLTRAALKDGVVDPAAFDKWKATHSDALAAMPELAKRLSSAADATRAMQKVAKQAIDTRQAVERSAVGTILKLGADASDADISRKVGNMLGSQGAVKTMRELVNQARGEPEALAGLRRAVVDYALTQFTREENLSAAALKRWMSRNRAALETVLDGEQMGVLNAVLAASDRISNIVRSPGGGSPTTEYLMSLSKREKPSMIREMLNHVVGNAVQSGVAGGVGHALGGLGLGINTAVGAFLSRAGIDALRARGFAKVHDLMLEAILDPQLGRTLMMKAAKEKGKGSARVLERTLASGLIGAISGGREQARERAATGG